MDEQTYKLKREELKQRYPVYLSQKWLRNSRIVFTVLLLILVKVTQSTLPVYDIKCVQDNVLESAVRVQRLFTSDSVILGFQYVLLISCAACVLTMITHWLLISESLKFPIVILLFYFVKLLSDTSLVLDKPNSVRWVEMSIGFITLSADRLFFSNVDPFAGILLICFLYSFEVQMRQGRIAFAVLSAASFLFCVLTQVVFQLVHSFAIFSALIVVAFSYIVADDIANFLTRKKFESEIITNPVRSIAEPDALEINPEHV